MPHHLWTPDEEHLIEKAKEWLDELTVAWARRNGAREQDELVRLNRGAPEGELTEPVKQLRDAR